MKTTKHNIVTKTQQHTTTVNSKNGKVDYFKALTEMTEFVMPEHERALLFKFRNVFLQVVRKHYFNQMSTGKLPRGSNAALALLNSIDVGLETCHTPGLQDWDAVKHINNTYKSIIMSDTLMSIAQYLYLESFLLYLRDLLTSDLIHMCLSFIEAHEYAQKKVPYYLQSSSVV